MSERRANDGGPLGLVILYMGGTAVAGMLIWACVLLLRGNCQIANW